MYDSQVIYLQARLGGIAERLVAFRAFFMSLNKKLTMPLLVEDSEYSCVIHVGKIAVPRSFHGHFMCLKDSGNRQIPS